MSFYDGEIQLIDFSTNTCDSLLFSESPVIFIYWCAYLGIITVDL